MTILVKETKSIATGMKLKSLEMPCATGGDMRLPAPQRSCATGGSMRLPAPHRYRSITIPKRRRRLSHRRLSAHCELSTITDWEFNVFTMESLTNGRSMFHVGLRMLQDHGLIETFNLDIIKLMRCLTLIEDGYLSTNPYHNSTHAADVAQAMNCYLHEPQISGHLTALEKMTAIFSALTHDVAHPGVSNAFLINTNNHLAALYNNESVLENHHWRTAMSIFHQTELFAHLDKTTLVAIETQTKSLILATDISKQGELLNKFKDRLDSNNFSLTADDNRHLALQIAIKCADLSNTTRPWEVSSKWSALVCQEFFKQGDMERKLGMPVTPLNDRYGTTVAQIQSGFMQFVVLPLITEWKRFIPSQLSDKMIHNLQANKAEWDAVIQQTKAQENAAKQKENTESEEATQMSNQVSKTIDLVDTDNVKVGIKRSYSMPFGHRNDETDKHFSALEHLNDADDEDDDDDDDILESFEDFPIERFALRRHSLPVSFLNDEIDSPSRDSCRLATVPPVAFNPARRQSLPLSVHVQSGMDTLDVLEESPPISRMLEFEDKQPFDVIKYDNDSATCVDDVNGNCNDDTSVLDYELGTEDIQSSQTQYGDHRCLQKEHGRHYHKKRRCSAPNTQLVQTSDQLYCTPKRNINTELDHTNEQLYIALLARRHSLPIKPKDLNGLQALLARQSAVISRPPLCRRNSLPLSEIRLKDVRTKLDRENNSQGRKCKHHNHLCDTNSDDVTYTSSRAQHRNSLSILQQTKENINYNNIRLKNTFDNKSQNSCDNRVVADTLLSHED